MFPSKRKRHTRSEHMRWSKQVVGKLRNKGDAWDTLYKSIRVPKDESEDTQEHHDLREKMERILKEVEDGMERILKELEDG
jgi:hypothetical protein